MTGRERIANSIRHVVNITGANVVTITMEAPDALALANDLDFLARYREPNGMMGEVSGQVAHKKSAT